MKPKAIPIEEVVGMIPDGASLMFGGFMGVGSPTRLIDELLRQGKRDLTVIANDSARPGIGIGKLISARACPESRLLPDPGQAGGLPRQSGIRIDSAKIQPADGDGRR
jgi:hypothetical protein